MPKKYFKLWFSAQFSQAIIKVWSTFTKVVGVGKAHKYFPFTQSNNSQTATLFTPDKLLYRKIFMGAAQTRNF